MKFKNFLKDMPKVYLAGLSFMQYHLLTFYQHVVNIHFDIAADLIFKDFVDKVLVCGPHVF